MRHDTDERGVVLSRSAMRLVLATVLAVAMLTGPNYAGQTGAARNSRWTVHVRPFSEPAGREAWYWIGLRNDDVTERVLCMSEVRYQWTRADGTDGTSVAIGSPQALSSHYCADRSRRHLVLPGQTFFVPVGVGANPPPRAKVSAFVVGAIELCAETDPCTDRALALRAPVDAVSQ